MFQLHERSVGKLLKKLNFSSMSVRPLHPQSDLEGRRLLKKLRRAGPRRDPAGACRPAGRNLVSDAMKADSLHYEAVRIRSCGASSHAKAIGL
jgi:hypothetical protein